MLLNLSASPYARGRPEFRRRLVVETARRARVPVVLCNLVGGNDEILFDGTSLAADSEGRILAAAPGFEEAVVTFDLGGPEPHAEREPAILEPVVELETALVMGIRDYARKCGFSRAHLGLSGGVDSAVTAVLAVKALGAENVLTLGLPSPFSSRASVEDAAEVARRLGIPFKVVPIDGAYEELVRLAHEVVGEGPFSVMEENIQARIRGLLLMAVSNRTGSLLLSTGNKSEMAVGYCTLYGDMSGGLAAISDVFKTEVYELAALHERQGLMPRATIEKAPSAELRPGQKDEDTLPPYEVLDRILRLHVEENCGAREIVKRDPSLELSLVRRVLTMVARSEYKRKQAPPGLRVSQKAFGFGRRIPIVAHRLDFLNLPDDLPAS